MIDLADFRNDFRDRFTGEPRIFAAPGRVNLIGEHTDYNEGFVLPFAIEKRTFVACTARDDRVIRAYTRTLDRGTRFGLDEPPTDETERWATYLRGTAAVLRRDGAALKGADLLIDSDIPFGAGLSSSAALEVAAGMALTAVAGGTMGLREIALMGQEVENEFVGVRSGIMDQFASALSREGHLLLIDCRSLETTNIPFAPAGLELVLCDSKVKHDLAAGAYNRRREECEEGVRRLRASLPGISSLRDVTVADLDAYGHLLPPNVRRRCRHVVEENRRVLAAVDAIIAGDLGLVGELMHASHESLSIDYEVSCAELDLLVDTARTGPGVLGARMTGGGFGGCTINLVRREAFEAFKSVITRKFHDAFGHEPGIMPVKPSKGAEELE